EKFDFCPNSRQNRPHDATSVRQTPQFHVARDLVHRIGSNFDTDLGFCLYSCRSRSLFFSSSFCCLSVSCFSFSCSLMIDRSVSTTSLNVSNSSILSSTLFISTRIASD